MNHLGTVRLETERLILRKFEEKDIESFHENWGTDEKTHEHDWYYKINTIEDTKKFVHEMLERYNMFSLHSYKWAIELKSNHEVIGNIGVNIFAEKHQLVEIGYSLSSKYFRQGLMTEALTKVVDFLLNDVGVRIIVANTDSDNIASINLLKKVGFNLDATLPERRVSKKSGKVVDSCTFSIINKNFKG